MISPYSIGSNAVYYASIGRQFKSYCCRKKREEKENLATAWSPYEQQEFTAAEAVFNQFLKENKK